MIHADWIDDRRDISTMYGADVALLCVGPFRENVAWTITVARKFMGASGAW